MDHYFTEYENAYNTAKEQKRVGPFNQLEICYYNGVKQDDDEFINLIHLPLEEIYDYFSETPNRVPTNFVSNIPDQNLKDKIQNHVSESIRHAWSKKNKICDHFKEEVSRLDPNFDEPLRILFVTTNMTTVGQYITKNIENEFRKMGYETFISIESNEIQTWGANDSHENANYAWHLRNILDFNPHVIFTINWLNNTFLNDKVFNFVWFQDPMPILEDNTNLILRERDYYFYLVDDYRRKLINKGISEEKLFPLSMATNKEIFFYDNSIQKEKKIVFLGGDYTFDKNEIKIDDKIKEEIVSLIQRNELTFDSIKNYSKKIQGEFQYFNDMVIPALVRRETILWLIKLENIKIEVYGPDTWLNVEQVAPFYKGLLPYGEAMAKVYNSAEYALVSHCTYRYQQRLFEISACGTIPIVYKGNLQEEEFHHEDNVLTFNTFSELQKLIGQKPKKDPKQISDDITYESLAKKIIDIVNNKINNDN